MTRRHSARSSFSLAIALALLIVLSGIATRGSGEQTRGGPVILVVGELGSMKTRNPLPALAQDIPTRDVLDLVYDAVGKALPETDALAPYILKGIDVDGDGKFEGNEYGEFEKPDGGDILNITAYYDFNGVYFHDGVQATVGDLFFSYQLAAMNPRMNSDLLVLMDRAGRSGSNYTSTRWLFITPAAKDWGNEPQVGDPSLRVAVRFHLQEPFALFANLTLAGCRLFPRHIWEQTGWRIDTESGDTVGPLHEDFGIAIYPESDSRFGLGIQSSDPDYGSFVYLKSDTIAEDSAEEWQLADADVIGSGPFIFKEIDNATKIARMLANRQYFAGVDSKTGVTVDSLLPDYINQPFIDGIDFIEVPSTTMCLVMLESSEIDYCHLSFPPYYLQQLVTGWDVKVWGRPSPSFTYLGYNLRHPSVGNWHYGQPDQFDVGYHFRKAVAHLIDKGMFIRDRLQGYGVAGIVPVNPQNTRFYNESLTPYELNSSLAQQELDFAHADAAWLAANGGPAEADSWFTRDSVTGRVIMPGFGLSRFNIVCQTGIIQVWGDDFCELIVDWMRAFGIIVGIVPFSSDWALEYMHVAGWNIASDDPDFLFDLFHSSRAATGPNYAGFNDPLMDNVLEASRREMNQTKRIALLKWAQGIIADKLPYDTLYFKTNIEATNQGRFVGWKPVHGTVWNYWSLLNIRPPSRLRLFVSLESPSAIVAGGSAVITVSVRDQDGNPVDGASVRATVLPEWAGNLSAGGGASGSDITVTASLGKLTLRYIAPSVDIAYNVTITATATYPQLPEIPESGKSFVIAVYPAAAKFLGVTIRFLDTDIVPSSDTIWFEVSITDRDGFAVPDSLATAATNPPLEPPYGIEPSQWNGSATSRLRFKAPPGNLMAANQTPIVLTVSADSLDDGTGNASVVFLILRLFMTCPDGTQVPTDEECSSQLGTGSYTLVAIVTIVSVGAAAIVSFVVEEWSRRGNAGGGKR